MTTLFVEAQNFSIPDSQVPHLEILCFPGFLFPRIVAVCSGEYRPSIFEFLLLDGVHDFWMFVT